LPAGSYTLTVFGSGQTTGAYSFRLLDLAQAAVIPDTTVSGTLSPANSTDAYQFHANAGDKYYFAHLSYSSGNTVWRLIDPYGNVLFGTSISNDGGLLTLTATGTYTLLVEGYIGDTGTSKYQVQLFQQTVDVMPSDGSVPFLDKTGPVSALGTATFNVQFQGDGNAHMFDLDFVGTATGDVVGSIPVTINEEYFYAVKAFDADGDPLTYKLVQAPAGMAIDPSSGLITWRPTAAQLGTNAVTVQVADNRGSVDMQSFTVNVTDAAPGSIQGAVFNDLNGNGSRDFVKEAGAGSGIGVFTGYADGLRGAVPYFPLPWDGSPGVIFVGTGEPYDSGAIRIDNNTSAAATIDVSVSFPAFRGAVPTSGAASPFDFWGPQVVPAGEKLVLTQTQFFNFDSSDLIPLPGAGPSTPATAADPGYATVTVTVNGVRTDYFDTGHVLDTGGFDSASVGNEALQWRPIGTTGLSDPGGNSEVLLEPGLHSWTVYLDLNHDGKFDPGEPFTTTDATGHYSFSNVAPGTYTVAEVGQPGWRQTAPASGTFTVAVQAGQTVRGPDIGNTQLNAPGPRAPKFTSTPPDQATVDQRYRYQPVVNNPDSQDLTFDLPIHPDGMVVDPVTGAVAWIPTADQVGTQNAVLRVEDARGDMDLQAFQIAVSVNDPPVILSPPRTTAVLGQTYHYPVKAVDPDGDSVTYSLQAGPEGMTIDPNSGLILWAPTSGQMGTNAVTVVVTDTQGLTANQSFNLQVVPASGNQTPTISSTPPTAVGLGQTYRYAVQASDADSDPLTYSLTSAPAGMTIDANGLITWNPTAAQFGPNAVTVHVDDGRGGSADQSFTVQVGTQPITHPPSITSTPPGAATVGSLYAYNATGADPDSTPLVWSLDTAPLGMVIDSTTGRLRWIPTADALASQNVVLRLTNGEGLSVTQSFTVTIRAVNVPPVISSEPLTQIGVGQGYSYPVRASDVDGGPLNYSLTSGPSGMSIDPTTGLIQWAPTAAQVGTQSAAILVDDGRGGTATQSWSVVVSATAILLPPTITSAPSFAGAVGQAYTYQVTATDPQGQTLAYSLGQAPARMTIDPGSGLVQWTPDATQTGTQAVQVIVTDQSGLAADQTFSLNVIVNHPPVISSVAPATITAGLLYAYDVRATDPDGDPLTYTLTSGPAGMTLDSLGRLRWQTGIPNIGTAHVSLTAADDRGAAVSKSFDVTVQADTQAPKVNLSVSASPVDLGTQETFVVTATDNVGVTALGLTVGGTHVALDPTGRATLTMNTAGDIGVVATVSDAAGNAGTASATISVIDPRDTNPPAVSFDTPADGTVITAATNIVGTVSDSNLLYYTLSIAPVGSDNFTQIARGTSTVSHGVLGQFDPSLLSNDSYDLRLYAANAGGLNSTIDETISVAGGLKLGNFKLSFTDLSIPVAGIPITVTRTYDSLDAANSEDFGYGWRLEFRNTDLRTSVAPTGSEADGIYNPFSDGTRVYVTLPGGTREGFTFHPTLAPGYAGSFLGIYRPSFTPDAGVTDQLSVPSFDLTLNDDGTVSAYGDGLAYNPASPAFDGFYVLTTKDGLSYQIDGSTGQLLTATDANGNTLTFSDSGIVSSAGPQVTFDRDPQGRITSVTDPAGNKITYQYGAAGDLTAVTNRTGDTTQFVYAAPRPHYLTQVIDPLGHAGIRTNYDDQGRLVAETDADGKTVQLSYDPTHSTETVKDQLGNPTTYEYDDRGNIVTEVDALGGVTKRTYDASNHMLSETDPLGHTTSYTYDGSGNVLTETDPLGHVTRHTYQTPDVLTGYGRQILAFEAIPPHMAPFYQQLNLEATTTDALGDTTTSSYDTFGNLVSTTGPSGGATSFTYDASGNPASLTDADGNTTAFVYDGAGHLLQQTDALGHVTSYTYDADGNQLTQTTTLTTPAGVRPLVTSTTYDAQGHVLTETDANGNVTTYQYDAAGKQTAVIDARGNKTSFVYDDRGEQTETINPDGTTTQTQYDAAGHVVARIDEQGRKTQSVYDALGRQVQTIYPDGTSTSTEYDAAGQVTAQVDERGNRTTFQYDGAGNQTAVTDALGHTTVSTYDTANRLVAETDPLGHTTSFVLDAAGRQVETDYADGTKTSVAYDAAGRVVARTDQLGRTTHYQYDALGRLTAVLDALGQTTAYTYDEASDLVSQTDADGHVTRYEYDGLGHRTATVLPLGQRSTTAYDAVGNTVATTDFNGHTVQYQYDARNRLTAQLFPDGTSVVYTYTADGQRATVTDARGVTAYVYDERDRLVQRTDPDGTVIAYGYDAAGDRTSVTTPAGTTAYTFDALGRVATVTVGPVPVGPTLGTTSYVYNAAGNLTETDFPNGTKEVRQYDVLNRLTYLENDGPSGVISSYRYTLGPTGRRDAVVEDTGRRVDYGYDALDRLTREAISDAVFGNRTIDYTYDPVGNRLTRNDSAEGLTVSTYDNNDRLLTETLGGQVTRYTYDDNGNTLSKVTSATDQASYAWDFQNRMVSADVTSSTGTQHTDYHYDADGIRVSQTTAGVETRYLIDTVQPYPEVLLEYRPSGLVVASYVYGNALILQNRGGTSSYYLVDGLGSTRALADASGAVTDRYVYDAFGRVIAQTGNTVNSYLFAGQQRDATTGLDYLRARYLNATTGRFVSRDRFAGVAVRPLSLNHYLYASDSPVNRIDPSGREDIGELSAAEAVSQILLLSAVASIGQVTFGFLGGAVGGSGAVKWDATLTSITTGQAVGIQGGAMTLVAKSETTPSVKGAWVIGDVGLGASALSVAGVAIPTPTQTSGYLYTPAFFLRWSWITPLAFTGVAWLFNAAAGGGLEPGDFGLNLDFGKFGGSFTIGTIGFGVGDFSGQFAGLDFSIGLFAGFSVPIPGSITSAK
jgi:RHS repeat-associated protein